MEATAKQPEALGPIQQGAIYPLPVFQRLLGLNADAMRKARRAGLKTRKWGRRKIVIGDEALAFARTCPEA